MKTIFFGTPDLGKEEIKAVTDVLKSKWIGFGGVSQKFEKELINYVGAKDGAVLSSCTAALHLALILNNVKPGDEIITTPLTFAATVNVFLYVGAKPIFVDINPKTLNIDENLIEQAITKKTRGIVPVHFAGLPCDMKKINLIAKKHNLFVVEDAAHAIGASYYGKKIGNSNNLTCFSFYANKNLTSIEGGFIASNNKKFVDRVKVMRIHGLSKDAWKRYSDNDVVSNEVMDIGFKYNITDIQSAVGLVQLSKVDKNLLIREKYSKLYDDCFEKIDGVSVQSKSNNDIRHALHLYVIILDPTKFKVKRDRIILELRKNGIFAVIHYKPVHLHRYYRQKYGFKSGDFPIAEKVADNIITLPLLPQLSLPQVQQILSKTKKVLQKFQ